MNARSTTVDLSMLIWRNEWTEILNKDICLNYSTLSFPQLQTANFKRLPIRFKTIECCTRITQIVVNMRRKGTSKSLKNDILVGSTMIDLMR